MPCSDSPSVRAADVFKAYDIRGRSPEQLDERIARAVGEGLVSVGGVPREGGAVVIGRDMRPTSPMLAAAVAAGVRARGASVVDIGLASTDLLYFASGRLDLPGVMVTASHNPAEYNGLKLCRAGAAPIGHDTGLRQLQAIVEARLRHDSIGTVEPAPDARLEHRDLLPDYVAHLHHLAPVRGRRLTVVVDAGNGMAGHTVPAVFAGLDVRLVPLYFDLDGTFPNHAANPIEPANLADLSDAVRRTGADLGLAFDGDADRCFAVDETGAAVASSALTALIADRVLTREPGATIIHNLITSRAVPELVRSRGGTPVRTRVGHSFIKARMAETGAAFGGEHSGHYYFRDFWRADSGMLAALQLIGALAETDRSASTLLAGYTRYAASGEINSTVDDPAVVLDRLRSRYEGRAGVSIDLLDGLTVEHDDWWFNVRASNTEPLVRLNVEGADETTMARIRDEALAVIRSDNR